MSATKFHSVKSLITEHLKRGNIVLPENKINAFAGSVKNKSRIEIGKKIKKFILRNVARKKRSFRRKSVIRNYARLIG